MYLIFLHLKMIWMESQVAKVFYEDKDLDRIIHYCEKDVVATIQLI